MTIRILIGDCREVLHNLPDKSVHCVVTSPPYWGLRDYGNPPLFWGGDAACEHVWQTTERGWNNRHAIALLREKEGTEKGGTANHRDYRIADNFCHCGAWRGAFGLEPSLHLYIEHTVEVFREVWRVLRNDGTLWLNLGDSYSTHAAGRCADPMKTSGLAGVKTQEVARDTKSAQQYRNALIAEKNLIGIPWRVAFALQADGWYLRQDIIWSKPNPMPESVRDRCTKAHEYLFLLSKSERYYFDAQAIQEPIAPSQVGRIRDDIIGGSSWEQRGQHSKGGRFFSGMVEGAEAQASTRNRRSVWEVTTQPFSEAHFATFPPALIEPCILAGCPKGSTVLDPFAGAGTTGLVADRLGRNAILIELNEAYAEMARRRIAGDCPLFTEVAAE